MKPDKITQIMSIMLVVMFAVAIPSFAKTGFERKIRKFAKQIKKKLLNNSEDTVYLVIDYNSANTRKYAQTVALKEMLHVALSNLGVKVSTKKYSAGESLKYQIIELITDRGSLGSWINEDPGRNFVLTARYATLYTDKHLQMEFKHTRTMEKYLESLPKHKTYKDIGIIIRNGTTPDDMIRHKNRPVKIHHRRIEGKNQKTKRRGSKIIHVSVPCFAEHYKVPRKDPAYDLPVRRPWMDPYWYLSK